MTKNRKKNQRKSCHPKPAPQGRTETVLSNITAELQIDFARQILENCRIVLSRPVPKQGFSDETKKSMEKLRTSLATAIRELDTPTLKLAVIGTTSSGKSTLLNALIGHYILPTAVEQMSAGIVEIFHEDRDDIALEIEKCDKKIDVQQKNKKSHKHTVVGGAINKKSVHSNEIFSQLAAVLKRYNENRHNQPKAPFAKIRCRTLLGDRQDLLRLPAGVRLQLIDLPGVREMNDTDNLSVVQQSLKKTILINVLEYTLPSEQVLNTVLGEVKDVIDSFGNASSIFFVLNKIDLVEPGSPYTVEDRIKELQIRIAPMLKQKPSDVVIIPISAIQLVDYVCGSAQHTAGTLTDEHLVFLATGIQKRSVDFTDEWYEKLELFAKRVSNASGALAQGGSVEVKQLNQDNLDKALKSFRPVVEALLPEQSHQMIKAAWAKSGCKDFVTTLRERIQNQLARLVLQPVTFAFQTELEEALPKLHEESRLALEKSKGQLEKLIASLESAQKKMNAKTETIIGGLNKSIKLFIENLSIGNHEGYTAARMRTEKDTLLKPFEKIIETIDKINSNASTRIFKEISYFFNGRISPATLHSKLLDAGCSYKEVTTFVERISDFPDLFSRHSGSEIKLEGNLENRLYLEKIEKLLNDAHASIPLLLSSYFSLQLQRQQNIFEKIMGEVIQKVKKELYQVMINECEIDKATADTLIPSDDFIAKSVTMPFEPEQLRIPEIVKVKGQDEKKTVYDTRAWGQYLMGILYLTSKQPRYIPRTVEDHYVKIEFRTADEMVDLWANSVSRALGGLSAAIAYWIEKNSDGVLSFLKESFSNTIRGYSQVADERRKMGEEEYRAIEGTIRSYVDGWITLEKDDKTGIAALDNLYKD